MIGTTDGTVRPRVGVPDGRRRVWAALVVAMLALVLASCAAGVAETVGTAPPGAEQPAGFWLGLWHGLILPVTFVISLFTDTVNIYEVHNSGNLYDLGFALGIATSVGGSHSGRGR